jgi:hypothetical protein
VWLVKWATPFLFSKLTEITYAKSI